jgi:hypothetical protein
MINSKVLIVFIAADERLYGIIIFGLGFSEKQKQT